MRVVASASLFLLSVSGLMAAAGAQTVPPETPSAATAPVVAATPPVAAPTVPAPPAATPAANGQITATIAISGQGMVRWDGGTCGPAATCTATLPPGKPVVFKSNPMRGAALVEWTDACSGYKPTCKVTPTADFKLGARYGITSTR